MKFELFIAVMWLVVAFCFNGVSVWHDWAVGIITGGCLVSVGYRLALRHPKARRWLGE